MTLCGVARVCIIYVACLLDGVNVSILISITMETVAKSTMRLGYILHVVAKLSACHTPNDNFGKYDLNLKNRRPPALGMVMRPYATIMTSNMFFLVALTITLAFMQFSLNL
jgi:hypothetical protein